MHDIEQEHAAPLGLLIAVQTPEVDEAEVEASLAELARLAKTFGIEVVERVSQCQANTTGAMYIGPGKAEALAERLEALRAEHPGRPVVAIVDDELTPWQQRNLSRALGCDDLMDRTELILEIFHRHAHSREARAQVMLVRLAYQAPRLREKRRGADVGRVRGGGKGAGESALELGRRQVRDRIAELRQELERIAQEREVRRARRAQTCAVALVGYTNAGKSTLMRALTDSQVLVEDKLFATLDATVRTLSPPVSPTILVSDTVGFIRKLPHALVASFRSTLEVVLEAGALLHVVDVSDPEVLEHIATTTAVLDEIGASHLPVRFVFNKVDRLEQCQPERAAATMAELRCRFPDALFISAQAPEDVARVHRAIVIALHGELEERTLTLGHDQGALRAELFARAEVLDERYDAHGGTYRVRATAGVLEALSERVHAQRRGGATPSSGHTGRRGGV